MFVGHVLLGRAELDALEDQITLMVETISRQADELIRLHDAIRDHRTACNLAIDEDAAGEADQRLWGVL